MQELLDQLELDLERGTAHLPSLPSLALRIRAVVDDPRSDSDTVARAVSADPAITAKLLRLANSVAYFRGKRVDTVSAAVVRLGGTMVRDMVTCLVMEQLFRARAVTAIRDHLNQVWQHSVRVAAISHCLAGHQGRISPERALLAGLVHDIGQLYLLEFMHREVPELFAGEAGVPKVIANRHPEVGARILTYWGFEPDLVAAAAEHRSFSRIALTKFADVCDIVLVANLLSFMGNPDNPYIRVDLRSLGPLRRLELDAQSAVQLLRDAAEEITQVEAILRGRT